MSKYNNMKSIKITEIKEKNIPKAIKEWSEKSAAMEELLNTCRNNNIETFGCHVGTNPYIDIIINDSYDKVNNILKSIENIDGLQIMVSPNGGNPKSSNYFYLASINIGFRDVPNLEKAEEIFSKMTNGILKKTSSDSVFKGMLDFYKFFEEEDNELTLYASYKSNKYTFNITSRKYKVKYLKNLFSNTDLIAKPIDNPNLYSWEFSCTNKDDFYKKLNTCYNYISNNYNLEIPYEIDDDMSSQLIIRTVRRQFIAQSNETKFNKWLKKVIKKGDKFPFSKEGSEQYKKWLKEFSEKTIKKLK